MPIKPVLFGLGFCLASLHAGAQITIGRMDMPAAGDAMLYTNVSDSIDVRETGSNHIWDFSQLTDVYQDSARYRNPGDINPMYSLAFMGAAGVQLPNPIPLVNDYYGFFRTPMGAYNKVGTALTIPMFGLPLVTQYVQPDRIFKLPLNYGDKDSCMFSGSNTIQGFKLSSTGKRVTVVDGWGKVKTPFKTFDCLRVRSVVVQVDTVGFAPVSYSRVEYKWLAKGEKIPVMEVVVPGPNSAYPYTVRYKDKFKNLTNPNGPQVNFTVMDSTVTAGDTVQMINMTTGGITWKWTVSPGTVDFVSNTTAASREPRLVFNAPGLYTISLQANSFGGSNTLTKRNYIVVSPATAPRADFMASRTAVFTGEDVQLNDLSTNSPKVWNWSFTPGGVAFQKGTSESSQHPVVRFTMPGKYSVKLECANSGGSHSNLKIDYIKVTLGTSVGEAAGPLGLRVYPSVTSGPVQIALPEERTGQAMLQMTDAAGRSCRSETVTMNGGIHTVDMASFPSGMYFIRLQLGNEVFTGKVIRY